MPKTPSFPTCLDEVNQISISSLKSLGYLRPDEVVSGSFGWTRNGKSLGSIAVEVSLPDSYIELEYGFNGKPISYRVMLESIPAHFGGNNWYFICPVTGKRCRKLYGIGEYFLSRFAFPSAMYTKQTKSKGSRDILRLFELVKTSSEFLSKPYVRTMYKGKLTKRYRRLLERQEKACDADPFERFRQIRLTHTST